MFLKKMLLPVLLLISFNLTSQVQIGQDIDGEAAGDGFGSSVSLSSDGSIMAVGAVDNDGAGSSSGHVRIYEYDNIATTWNQLGQDIDGEAIDDFSGWSVSLSSDGSIIAIGAMANDGNGTSSGHVRVYEYDNGTTTWIQLGQDVDGIGSFAFSGYSLSLSSNGSTVAIGAPQYDGVGMTSGITRIYEYASGAATWSQKGQDIEGTSAEEQCGWSVSLSSSGSIVAIASVDKADNGSSSGQVRVFEFDSGTSMWNQVGQDINGEAIGDLSGWSISLSSDGGTIAIGAIGNDGNGSNSGHVRVYQYNTAGSVWNQIGQDINGEAAGDQSGISVSLTLNGSIVAIGALSNDGNGSNSGHTRVYQYQSGTSIWNQVGQDIDGEAVDDKSGEALSISSDGSILAIGGPRNDGNGANSGHVRIWDLTVALPVNLISFDARESSGQIILKWETAQEVNNEGFYVERSSTGYRWELLGFVKGSGESNNVTDYKFTDNNPLELNYYRLQQIDYDGGSVYSKTVSIGIQESATRIYPNPAQEAIYLTNVEEVIMKIYSSQGQLLVNRIVTPNEAININGLPIGIYVVEIISSKNTAFTQLIKT